MASDDEHHYILHSTVLLATLHHHKKNLQFFPKPVAIKLHLKLDTYVRREESNPPQLLSKKAGCRGVVEAPYV
jgi:hypothetical protein